MDFYTSPIAIEVDGVNIKLKIVDDERKPTRTPGTRTPDSAVVPNPADLAQSFLDTQPSSERRKLEEALAEETQDLGASVTMSDDGSDDDLAYGTGQALSLPTFLADFLQGIVDRMQIKIKGVTFQLDVQVPVEPGSTNAEPVSFQIAMDGIDVEGVTTQSVEGAGTSEFVSKEGKRHVSLANVRAYLISEANVFSALARSPSMTSPSVPSSPSMTRNPPSRESSTLSQEQAPKSEPDLEQEQEDYAPTQTQSVPSLQGSFVGHFSQREPSEPSSSQHLPLGDSEDALGIPYTFDDEYVDEAGDESPATPKASMYHDFNNPSPESPIFHSTMLPTDTLPYSLPLEDSSLHQSLGQASTTSSTMSPPIGTIWNNESLYLQPPEEPLSRSDSIDGSSTDGSTEDLAKSLMYTHEEAESMYMSAFSAAPAQSTASINPTVSQHLPPPPSPPLEKPKTPELSEARESKFHPPAPPQEETIKPKEPTERVEQVEQVEPVEPVDSVEPVEPADSVEPVAELEPVESVVEVEPVQDRPTTPRPAMPGGWNDDYDDDDDALFSSRIAASITGDRLRSSRPNLRRSSVASDNSSEPSSPAFSRASLGPVPIVRSSTPEQKPQDDVETPKGPTKLVKEILNLKNISIYVPSNHQHIHVQAASPESVAKLSQSMGRSVYPQAPGAFSVHGAKPLPPHGTSTTSTKVDNELEVILSPVTINFDTSLGFLLAMVVGKLMGALKDSSSSTPSARGAQGEPAKKSPEVKLALQEISLNFLNRLGGVSETPERYLDPSAFIFEQEVLLNATLQNLTISVSPTEMRSIEIVRGVPVMEPATFTKIDVQRFRFGYANGDIISFNQDRYMSTSVNDAFLSLGIDVGIQITQTQDVTRIQVDTLPLEVQVDLQRLDETFSWFGGLSSFLNMSASMTSSPSPTPRSTFESQQKPRGVRFDTPIDPQDKSAAAQNKLDVRIEGTYVELVGKDCSVTAQSSALKLVSRDEGIGIRAGKLRVAGPYLRNSSASPAITTEVGGLQMDFLTKPTDSDLDKLLELIIPKKIKFDNDDDMIMIDTLMRQRRKGSVLRLSLDAVNVRVQNMSQLTVLPNLGEEIAKLATVAKYLPEDDRPGLLTLGKISKLSVSLDFGGNIGHIGAELDELNAGHITIPSLIAVAAHGISVKRNKTEELVGSSKFGRDGPVLMARMIGDEIEPTIKLKMQDLRIEYRVSTVMQLLDLGEDPTPQDFEASLAASVVNLGDQAHNALAQSPSEKSKASKPMTLDVGFSDCLVGLNPLGQPSKMVLAFTDAHLNVVLPKGVETSAEFNIKKASILLIDDATAASAEGLRLTHRRQASSSRQIENLCEQGFVDICLISSAKAVVDVKAGEDGERQLNVELHDDLLVLQLCADSTQTLIGLANALKPPTPPSKEEKYRTNVMPVQDLLASISAEAFGKPEGEYDFDQDFAGAQEMAGSSSEPDYDTDSPLQVQSQYYQDKTPEEELFDATSSSILPERKKTKQKGLAKEISFTGLSAPDSQASDSTSDLVIHEDYYNLGSYSDSRAKVWNRSKNRLENAPDNLVKRSPVKVSVKDVHLIVKLFDGYDWIHTRDVITKAVQDVENKALDRQSRGGASGYDDEDEEEEAISDFLFNSIYIGIPSNRDPQELSRAINAGLNINDTATETESVATTAFTATTTRTSRPHQPKPKSKRLKLKRSKDHKISVELSGVNVDLFTFDSGKTMSSINVRINNAEVIDNIPTSTWKKFATYDKDMGERETGSSMAHIELLTVKPLVELAASEFIVQAKVLPLRLHVDQDALDFLTRFFEFKDDNGGGEPSPSDIPFIQRAEVHNIPVKLDFKPKRVDYAGLRSGHTTEFMNFITLDQSRLVLRHVIIHGVSGFDRLGKTLQNIWTPDVTTNQLPGVLAGLAPVRSLATVGSGFKDLVEIPIAEYKKDGRIIRSISKGASAFARTTGTEIIKLGAKLAVGTQYALQGAEGLLTEQPHHDKYTSWDGDDDDELEPEEKKQISLYADQPTGIMAGLRGGLRSLARDVNLARDAIVAVPGEVMQSASPGGALKAAALRAPTIIFRPAMGVTKAVSQTLMGVTNAIDPENQRRIEDVSISKYPTHLSQNDTNVRCRNTNDTKPPSSRQLNLRIFCTRYMAYDATVTPLLRLVPLFLLPFFLMRF